MQMLSPTGLLVRFPEGIAAINPGDDRRADRAALILNSLPTDVSGWNGRFSVSGEGQHVFFSAGEYECNGLTARGYGCETVIDDTPMQTTSWLLHGDGVTVLVLGAVSDGDRVQKMLSDVDAVDVLVIFCPVSGAHLAARDIADCAASKQASKIMLVGDDADTLQRAGKEIGDPTRVEGRYTVKKKELGSEGSEVIILS